MKKTRCFSVLPGRLRLLRIGLGSAAFLSGALLLADVLVNAGGGSSNADKTGNGGGILDYGQVTFSGSASYENNTVRGFSQGGAVYAGSVVQQAAVSFTGNRAEGGSGGALYSRGNVQVAAGSSFSGNAAAHNGGALCLDANDGEEERTVNVEGGCSFTGNSAGNLGGAVYVSGGSAEAPTVLNLRSTDSSRPVSFSGNFRGRSAGASTGGVPNSITVMGHVRLVMACGPGLPGQHGRPSLFLRRVFLHLQPEKDGGRNAGLRRHFLVPFSGERGRRNGAARHERRRARNDAAGRGRRGMPVLLSPPEP